jgi:hypothetical protein
MLILVRLLYPSDCPKTHPGFRRNRCYDASSWRGTRSLAVQLLIPPYRAYAQHGIYHALVSCFPACCVRIVAEDCILLECSIY